MRLSALLTTLAAVVLTALLLAGAWIVLRPSGPALAGASLSLNRITPNADGDRDATRITYSLRRPATVSIYFVDAGGQRFYFRQEKARESGEHQVDFSGVVEAYDLPSDSLQAGVLARVLQDGEYTWVVEASDPQGSSGRVTGTLTVAEADTRLPDLLNLSVSPPVFTPNQDGLDDRAQIGVNLSKEVGEGGLRVSLIGPDGTAIAIPERPSETEPGRPGWHQYDYDGGIDQGHNPPPDGTYTVRVEAEDRLGQKTVVTQPLTIRQAGLPRAEILRGEVEWSASTILLGETLFFTLTVENYGTAPLRTSGPAPGWVYGSMNENANTAGEYVQAGVWRVGINCETCLSDYPWRWALGDPDSLTVIPDAQGRPQYYLMPGERATVTGGIVLDQIVSSRNPQYFWAGLIHEEVGIALVNQRVDPEFVLIVPTE